MDEKQLLSAIGQMMDDKLSKALQPVNDRLDKIDERVSNIDERVLVIEERTAKTDERLSKIDERVSVIEERTSKTDERLSRIEDRTNKMELTMENIILPKMDLLFEGQKGINNSIKRLSVIDALQDDVSTLKTAVRYLSQEVDILKKAQ